MSVKSTPHQASRSKDGDKTASKPSKKRAMHRRPLKKRSISFGSPAGVELVDEDVPRAPRLVRQCAQVFMDPSKFLEYKKSTMIITTKSKKSSSSSKQSASCKVSTPKRVSFAEGVKHGSSPNWSEFASLAKVFEDEDPELQRILSGADPPSCGDERSVVSITPSPISAAFLEKQDCGADHNSTPPTPPSVKQAATVMAERASPDQSPETHALATPKELNLFDVSNASTFSPRSSSANTSVATPLAAMQLSEAPLHIAPPAPHIAVPCNIMQHPGTFGFCRPQSHGSRHPAARLVDLRPFHPAACFNMSRDSCVAARPLVPFRDAASFPTAAANPTVKTAGIGPASPMEKISGPAGPSFYGQIFGVHPAMHHPVMRHRPMEPPAVSAPTQANGATQSSWISSAFSPIRLDCSNSSEESSEESSVTKS